MNEEAPNIHAVELGKLGGQIGGKSQSKAKQKAARRNGRKGGRPKIPAEIHSSRKFNL